MKYKLGDRVIVKRSRSYNEDAVSFLESLSPSYVSKVIKIVSYSGEGGYYLLEDGFWHWSEDQIDGLYSPILTLTRFELLDL